MISALRTFQVIQAAEEGTITRTVMTSVRFKVLLNTLALHQHLNDFTDVLHALVSPMIKVPLVDRRGSAGLVLFEWRLCGGKHQRQEGLRAPLRAKQRIAAVQNPQCDGSASARPHRNAWKRVLRLHCASVVRGS